MNRKRGKEIKKEEKKEIINGFLEHVYMGKKNFGEKASDALTKWAGSWYFIFGLLTLLGLWMLINVYFLMQYQLGKPWDPYPFILLNLILSCLAAIQAPIILMSQNRQAKRNRLKAEYDYRLNKKAEKEIQEVQDEIREIKILLIGKKNKGKLK